MPTPTEQYITILEGLKAGDLGLLRSLAGQPLDTTLTGFDLFTGLWWPLREKSQYAPRREVAWLVAKLFACVRTKNEKGATLPKRLARAMPRHNDRAASRADQLFDEIVLSPLRNIEPHLQSAIAIVARQGLSLDWVQMTNDLSRWEDLKVRQKWTDQYLDEGERRM